jgi:hypothetical protein
LFWTIGDGQENNSRSSL